MSMTGAERWSGLSRKREKGRPGWQRRIDEEGFRIFKILFFFPRLIKILSRFKIERILIAILNLMAHNNTKVNYAMA
jgi:hypothetical protein